MFLDSSVTSGTCPTWNCEWHAAGWYVLHFTLICSCNDGQHTHTHTFISTGRDVPDIGHTRHKWSTVPEEYVTVSWFIHVVSNLSLLFSCFKGETSAPLLPFSFCKHSTALLHMILKLLIKHNTKDYPWLTSTNNMAWVYLIRLINMFSRFREVRLVQHQWM